MAGLIGLLAVILSVGGTILWIWMLIDCATNEPSEGNSYGAGRKRRELRSGADCLRNSRPRRPGIPVTTHQIFSIDAAQL